MGTMVRGWPRVKLPMSSGAEMEKRRVRAGWRIGKEDGWDKIGAGAIHRVHVVSAGDMTG